VSSHVPYNTSIPAAIACYCYPPGIPHLGRGCLLNDESPVSVNGNFDASELN